MDRGMDVQTNKQTCGHPRYYNLFIIQVIASLQNLFNKLHWTPLIAVSNEYNCYIIWFSSNSNKKTKYKGCNFMNKMSN